MTDIKQAIDIGSSANDGTGDPLRTAFDKANDNFTALFPEIVSKSANFTLALAEAGDFFEVDTTSGVITATIPAQASVDMGTDTTLVIMRNGANNLIIQADTGVSLNGTSGGSITVANDYNAVELKKLAGTDLWAGHLLQTSGSAALSNVVEDATPQLGGSLDVNGNSIVSTSAGNITLTPDTSGSIVLDNHTWPNADGLSGQILETDGAGTLSWVTPFTELVQDTTPQLGGDLDVNGNSIVSVSNGDIAITPNGTGSVILDGIDWPGSDGSSGYVLETNGAGAASFAARHYDIAFAFAGTPTASEVIGRVLVGRATTIADDFASAQGYVGTNPASSFVIDVNVNGTAVGDVTISTAGAFTFTTDAGALSLSAGDRLDFVAPFTTDGSISDIAITIVATET